MSKSGIVYVKMVITEEKILFNIEKIQKLINPKSKKQIIQLDDDVFFRDLIESVKTYLIEYPKKKNFPASVYKEAYGLVEYATTQFEENTKKIEELIRQRELNISTAAELSTILESVDSKSKDWKQQLKAAEDILDEDIVQALNIIGQSETDETEECEDAIKLVKARINNLETNLHIEIDMERIEDRSKALSYIGIEVADALKSIPVPAQVFEERIEQVEEIQEEVQVAPVTEIIKEKVQPIVENTIDGNTTIEQANEQIQAVQVEEQQYIEQTTFTKKPTLWQRFKNSKFVNAIKYITKIRIVIDNTDALPEGRGENN